MKLRVAEATARFIEQYNSTDSHAVLLTGPAGSGLGTLAEHVANGSGRILSIIRPESSSSAVPTIKVERVRELYVETRTTLEGKNFIIIDDADTMNVTAQNALLKLLEEPNQSIRFILTAHHPDKLLATVRSRTQSFSVPAISLLESRRLIKALGVDDEATERRLLYIAEGLPAELSRLATNKADFKVLAEQVQNAREFVQGSTYRRIVMVQRLKDDRAGVLAFIELVIQLLRRSLHTNPDPASVRLISRLLSASDTIRANGNIRLHLLSALLMV